MTAYLQRGFKLTLHCTCKMPAYLVASASRCFAASLSRSASRSPRASLSVPRGSCSVPRGSLAGSRGPRPLSRSPSLPVHATARASFSLARSLLPPTPTRSPRGLLPSRGPSRSPPSTERDWGVAPSCSKRRPSEACHPRLLPSWTATEHASPKKRKKKEGGGGRERGKEPYHILVDRPPRNTAVDPLHYD